MLHRDMMARMTASEFAHWRVLEQMEPFGEAGAYLRTGIVAATLANIHRDPKGKEYKPEDFMPKTLLPKEEPQSAEQLHAMMMMLMEAQNQRVNQAVEVAD